MGPQIRHHLGVCWKSRTSGLAPGLLNQNRRVNWIPRRFRVSSQERSTGLNTACSLSPKSSYVFLPAGQRGLRGSLGKGLEGQKQNSAHLVCFPETSSVLNSKSQLAGQSRCMCDKWRDVAADHSLSGSSRPGLQGHKPSHPQSQPELGFPTACIHYLPTSNFSFLHKRSPPAGGVASPSRLTSLLPKPHLTQVT